MYQWFHSYLEDRKQSVTVGDAHSDPQTLRFGVPQGSVLGPKLFSIYAAPLGTIIRRHGLQHHFYADDSQVYLSFDPRNVDTDEILQRIAGCVGDIQLWMLQNFLKLNESKTEVIMFGSIQQLTKVSLDCIPIGTADIRPSSKVRNLGVVQDTNMSMTAHVSRLCSSAHQRLREIGRIRPFLQQSTCEHLVHAFVTSRLDVGNALLFGINQEQINRLQRIQNSAARLVTSTGRQEHITPVLQSLHWLPVKQRIKYKILLQVYRAKHSLGPDYLAELLKEHVPSRSLRSGSAGLMVVPRTRTGWGDRSFQSAAPRLWNTLPPNIKQSKSLSAFKSNLKTFLFQTADW